MEFAIGLTAGIFAGGALTGFAAWFAARVEWERRDVLERRVDNLYNHLACGQGYIGCNGGPRCNWDHK